VIGVGFRGFEYPGIQVSRYPGISRDKVVRSFEVLSQYSLIPSTGCLGTQVSFKTYAKASTVYTQKPGTPRVLSKSLAQYVD
jgi:hypothetical protein